MRRHTGQKPYKCNQCEVSSTDSSDLQKHKRTHSGNGGCNLQVAGCRLQVNNNDNNNITAGITTNLREYKHLCTYESTQRL